MPTLSDDINFYNELVRHAAAHLDALHPDERTDFCPRDCVADADRGVIGQLLMLTDLLTDDECRVVVRYYGYHHTRSFNAPANRNTMRVLVNSFDLDRDTDDINALCDAVEARTPYCWDSDLFLDTCTLTDEAIDALVLDAQNHEIPLAGHKLTTTCTMFWLRTGDSPVVIHAVAGKVCLRHGDESEPYILTDVDLPELRTVVNRWRSTVAVRNAE